MPPHISLPGVDPGIFIGGSKVWFRQDCWTFLWQITSHKDDHVFLNLWTPVAVGAGNTILLCSRGKQIIGRYTQKQLYFWISLKFSLVANAMHLSAKKISQLKGQYKWYTILSQTSIRSDRGAQSPGSATTCSHPLLHPFPCDNN